MNKHGKYNITEQDNNTLRVEGESINPKTVNAPDVEPITINGAWYLDALPNQIVVELTDGSLTKFNLTPFRAITQNDFTNYKSYHPRKCKGQPLPDYLYRFYGLQKNEESLSEVIRVRITPSEKEKLESYCENLEPKTNTSELIRDYIRSLIK